MAGVTRAAHDSLTGGKPGDIRAGLPDGREAGVTGPKRVLDVGRPVGVVIEAALQCGEFGAWAHERGNGLQLHLTGTRRPAWRTLQLHPGGRWKDDDVPVWHGVPHSWAAR